MTRNYHNFTFFKNAFIKQHKDFQERQVQFSETVIKLYFLSNFKP